MTIVESKEVLLDWLERGNNMSFLQKQKEIREVRGGTRKERLEAADKRAFRRILDSSPNSKRVQLLSNYNEYDCLILTRRADLQITDKKFLFESDVPAKQGDIIKHGVKWLLLHEDTTEYGVSRKFIGRQITDEVYFFIDGQHIRTPIYSLLSASADDPLDRRIINSVFRAQPDKEAIVILSKNEFTEKIKVYDRFISFDLVYQVTFVNKNNEGLVILTARIVPLDSKTDNLETGKTTPADAEVVDPNVEIKLAGSDSLLEREEQTYTSSAPCDFSVEGNASIVSQTENSITVKATTRGFFTINAILNGEIKSSRRIRVVGLF